MLEDLLSGGVFGTNDLNRVHSAPITLHAVEKKKGTKSGFLTAAFPSRKILEPLYPELKDKPFLLPVVWGKRFIRYAKETRSGKSDAAETLRVAKERIDLLMLYGIV